MTPVLLDTSHVFHEFLHLHMPKMLLSSPEACRTTPRPPPPLVCQKPGRVGGPSPVRAEGVPKSYRSVSEFSHVSARPLLPLQGPLLSYQLTPDPSPLPQSLVLPQPFLGLSNHPVPRLCRAPRSDCLVHEDPHLSNFAGQPAVPLNTAVRCAHLNVHPSLSCCFLGTGEALWSSLIPHLPCCVASTGPMPPSCSS